MRMIQTTVGGNRSAALGSQSLRNFAQSKGRRPAISSGLARVGMALSTEFAGLAQQLADAPGASARRAVIKRCVARALSSGRTIAHINQLKVRDIHSAFAFIGITRPAGHSGAAMAAIVLLAVAALTGVAVPDIGALAHLEKLELSLEALAELGAEVGPVVADGAVVVETVEGVSLLSEALAALAATVAAVAALPAEMSIGVILFVAVVGVIAVRHIMGW